MSEYARLDSIWRLDVWSRNLDGMRFSIENPLIRAIVVDIPRRLRRLNQVAVLHDLGEQEALLQIRLITSTRHVHVANGAKAGVRSRRRVDCNESGPGPILVDGVLGLILSVNSGYALP